jgi:hypothetical protein
MMVPDWAEGLRRAARVTGITYAIAAAIYIPAYAYWHSLMGYREYTMAGGGQSYRAAALSRPEAVMQVNAYIAGHQDAPPAPASTWGATDPIVVSARVDPNSEQAWGSLAGKAGEVSARVAVFYVIFWALFRGVRWTISGVLNGPGRPSPKAIDLG